MNIKSLGYVGVESPQYGEWKEFAPAVFAATIAETGADETVYVKIDDRDYRIAVHPGARNRLAYLGWEVADQEELGQAVAELEAANVRCSVAAEDECRERRVAGMVSFADPAGLRFEIYHGAVQHHRSYAPPRRFSGFVTGDKGMGHVIVAVPDREAEHDFLVDVLGFKVTDFVQTPSGKATFYHVNSRHHSIAVVEVPGMRGLHHIMLQVNDIDDVGYAYDLVQNRPDLPLAQTLGRHSTCRMISFYVLTPSGFEIEYGYGAIDIDDATWVATESPFPADLWGHRHIDNGPPATLEPVDATQVFS